MPCGGLRASVRIAGHFHGRPQLFGEPCGEVVAHDPILGGFGIFVICRIFNVQHRELLVLTPQRETAVDGGEEIHKEISAGQRLYTFLAERAGSRDYRSQLGLISTIRRDFEALARLLKKDWPTEPGAAAPTERIVLYIDDLDRCSPKQVVDVLQAVHLLLALDLFVVVVGVDPRWLVHSLKQQYREVLSSDDTAPTGAESTGPDPAVWQSTPLDYLEKIFNIPFMLPVMDATGFGNLIRKLSATIPASGRQDHHDQDPRHDETAGMGDDVRLVPDPAGPDLPGSRPARLERPRSVDPAPSSPCVAITVKESRT